MLRLLPRLKPYPDREDVTRAQKCPPHDFEGGWGIGADEDIHADTVPVLWCRACGDVRLLRVPQ